MITFLLVAALASADGPRVTVIDTGLHATRGGLVAIEPSGVTITTESGAARTFSPADVAIVAPEEWWTPARTWPGPIRANTGTTNTPILELADGSILPGAPRAAAAAGNLGWEHAQLGVLEFKLDQVRSITIPPAPESAPDARETAKDAKGDTDVLTLRNGDRVDGFVASIAPGEGADKSAVVKIESKGAVTTIPLSRVAIVRLANPPAKPAGVGVWLEGNTAATVTRAVLADGQPLTVWPIGAKEPRDVPATQVRAIVPDSARVRPLARLEIAGQKPAAGRNWWRPVNVKNPAGEIVGAAEVELPGPMHADWKLPENAVRLGGWVVLPEDCRAWGECQVIFSMVDAKGESELFRTALSDKQAEVSLNVELPGTGARTLRLTLAEGTRGAVQTRAVLRRAIVICK